jgi:hypothetical protein
MTALGSIIPFQVPAKGVRFGAGCFFGDGEAGSRLVELSESLVVASRDFVFGLTDFCGAAVGLS